MSTTILDKFLLPGAFRETEKALEQRKVLYTSKLHGSAKTLLAIRLLKKHKQIVILHPNQEPVLEYDVELRQLGHEGKTITITDFTHEALQEKLSDVSGRNEFIILSTYRLLECRLPKKEEIKKSTLGIDKESEVGYDGLLEHLNLMNYNSTDFVEVPGEFAKRGAIIDFWSYSEKYPVRLEFDGDFIESLRSFDPDNQRSISRLEKVSLAPLLGDGGEEGGPGDAIFAFLENPLFIIAEYDFLNTQRYSGDNGAEKEAGVSAGKSIDDDFTDFPETEPEESPQNMPGNYTKEELQGYTSTEGTSWLIEQELLLPSAGGLRLNIAGAPAVNSNFKVLFALLMSYLAEGYTIYITAENDIQTNRLKEVLQDYDETGKDIHGAERIHVVTLPLREGFADKESKLLVLTDYQIFKKPYRTKLPKIKQGKKPRSSELASIHAGDFVVHEDYGIGRYAGLETIKIGEVSQESMKLQYDEGGTVYVNLNYFHLVKKYSSKDAIAPKLSTLGSNEWANTKRKTKKKIKEIAKELIELYAKRKATPGNAFSPDTVWQKELEASFIYEDTPDQSRATEEVKNDLEAHNPMDRLVCGDVGFGKTEVAVRGAFKAVQDNKQVAILVPTTILTEQHYNTFSDRLAQFPVKIAALSRFQTRKQQSEIIKELSEGRIDIVIGTHRLLSKDLAFKDLGLLIIDEEHRFGVTAKEKLRSLKLNVDTLTLTATPIPRTLNLSLLGARDLSIIATPPPNRQPIYTKIEVFNIKKIREWIYYELNRNGQVYLVHDRVASIEQLAGYLEKHIPSVKFATAHGQMSPGKLEKVFHDFLKRKYDVLISTKIIESGLDIPNVNTIIINRADRFGLAELHQLRGRVGRSDKQAYAYLIVPSVEVLNKKTVKRLQAIEEFTELGAGFNLSMRDLEIRGAGNLLGYEQSGFINEVGFDLYIKLINEAVEELKTQDYKEIFRNLPQPEERTEPTIDTYFEIGIPRGYMPDQMDRLSFYTALYSIKNLNELEDIQDEITDKYGPFSPLVARLFWAAELKYYASRVLFEKIIIQRKIIMILLPGGEKENFYTRHFPVLMSFIMKNYRDTVKLHQEKEKLRLIINNNFESAENTLDFLIRFTKTLMETFSKKEESEGD
ncbi:MAG TPA: transcription-repair coupling factor [Ignavibacteriaceae bacterium]|nr:transcription-repair coupling factor [Ignavibacteriaceae bacterium]